MLPLLLHKCWFSNWVCNLAASCPLTPPKTKGKKKIVLGLVLWWSTCCGWREGQSERLCGGWEHRVCPCAIPTALIRAGIFPSSPALLWGGGLGQRQQWAVAGHLSRHPSLISASPETCLTNQWLKQFFSTKFCLIPGCVLVSEMTLNMLSILEFIIGFILLQKNVNRKCLENEALLSRCVWWPLDECPLCHRRCWLAHAVSFLCSGSTEQYIAVSGVMLGSPQLWLLQNSFVLYPNSWRAHALPVGREQCAARNSGTTGNTGQNLWVSFLLRNSSSFSEVSACVRE